jgi:hypothetical protein
MYRADSQSPSKSPGTEDDRRYINVGMPSHDVPLPSPPILSHLLIAVTLLVLCPDLYCAPDLSHRPVAIIYLIANR